MPGHQSEPRQPPLVSIVDSARDGYVEDPDVEREALHPAARVELCRLDDVCAVGDAAREAAVLIAWHRIPLPRPALEQLRHCRGIVRASVGYDNIDLEAATDLGVPICNVPDYGTEEVADHTLSLLLTLWRRLPALARHVRAGGWQWAAAGRLDRLRGTTLGIVGLGRIGTAVARRAQAFGLNVGFFDPYQPSGIEKAQAVVRHETLGDLLDWSRIVSLHVPLTAETRHMIGRAELERLGPDAVLLNTARGELIDQDALVEAVTGGRLGQVGLDVLSAEPRVPDELRASDRVLVTPHAAFYSDAALTELRRKSAETALQLLRGLRPRSLLNPGVAAHGLASSWRS
jgi:C-terminal binding protein